MRGKRYTTEEKIRILRESDAGSPWQNGYIQSFNGKLRDECLNHELYYTLYQLTLNHIINPLRLTF